MIWQDVALMLGGFAFAVALVPSLRSINKPAKMTCVITALTLALYCVAYATLGLWMAFSAALITKGMWIAVLIQRR